MSSYDLSNVLLPAVLISSAVFSTLTLPFALIKNEPIAVELPYFSGEILPIFNSEHKDVAIPYIGISIVASVGAGIASVEVNRRWQAYRSALKEEENLSNIQQSIQGNGLQQEALDIPEYRPEVSAINLSSHEFFLGVAPLNVKSTEIEIHDINVESPAPFFDFTQIINLQSNLSENPTFVNEVEVSEEIHLSTGTSDNYAVTNGSENVFNVCTNNLELISNNFLELPGEYQNCRLKVPYLNRRLLAINFNGEYYSFLRMEKTKENARETIEKLGYKLNKTVVTKTDKGYVIWVNEPEFC